MSTNQTNPSDTITIVCTRPAKNQTITVTLPAGLVDMLDWIAENVKNPDGSAKYLYGLNVLWTDAIELLLPHWQEWYINGQVAPIQAQLDTAKHQAVSAVQSGVQAMTVVGP